MSTWVIGDIHGCWLTLERLLRRIGYAAGRDELWLVGDLVNRGPGSLEVLRWAAAQPRLVVVLGNHDLHLLARAAGVAGERPEDRLDELLAAPDRDRLLDWLRSRAFLHRRAEVVMVHAGLLPTWRLEEAVELATTAAERLSGPEWRSFLARFGETPRLKWSPGLTGDARLAAAVTLLTRLRVVRHDGRPKLGFTGPPSEAPEGSRPWFETSAVTGGGATVLFGHWAQMGFERSAGAVCLDSGCVYGGSLSALRLEDGRTCHEPVADPVPPMEE
jgi:bis(5'-nucleosyl)-tetraphosphatase (symmetrical)